MGSKNRIFLGVITALILHHHLNKFEKTIYMSKRVQVKIKQKHADIFLFIEQSNFVTLMDATVEYCAYDKNERTINFIAYLTDEDKYILYSLKQEKHHTVCNTIFSLRPETLKTYYRQKNFKLLNNAHEEIIEEYIKT